MSNRISSYAYGYESSYGTPSADRYGSSSSNAYGRSSTSSYGSSLSNPYSRSQDPFEAAELWMDDALCRDIAGMQGKWQTLVWSWDSSHSDDHEIMTLHIQSIIKQLTLQVEREAESSRHEVPPLVMSTFFCDKDCENADRETYIKGDDGEFLWTRAPTCVDWVTNSRQRVLLVKEPLEKPFSAIRFFFGFSAEDSYKRLFSPSYY